MTIPYTIISSENENSSISIAAPLSCMVNFQINFISNFLKTLFINAIRITCCFILPGSKHGIHWSEKMVTHNRWSWRGRLVGRAWVLWVLGPLVQNVLFDHLEFAVFERDVAILEGEEDGVSILALKPLLRLQGRFRSSCVRVQVVLEQVGLRGRQRVTSWGENSTTGTWSTRQSLTRLALILQADHRSCNCVWSEKQWMRTHLSGYSHHNRLTLPFMQFIEPGNTENQTNYPQFKALPKNRGNRNWKRDKW